MKKITIMVLLVGMASLFPQRSHAQILDLINEAIKEAIMAIDLGVQQLQTKTIMLQDAQKQVENAMQQLDLDDITSWVQKQKDLYSEYYQELWTIKNAIATYQRVKDIIQKQEQIVADYKTAYALLRQDSHFSADELTHIYNVYTGIMNESVSNIERLTLVINSFVTQMSDGQRLKLIDGVGLQVDQNYADLHAFTQQNIQLSMERARDENDAAEIKALYGIQ